MSFTGLYVGSVLVVLDMVLTILALILNLAVVIGLRYRLYHQTISVLEKIAGSSLIQEHSRLCRGQ